MKIRIKGNSIRFRMTQSEVSAFCEQGYYEDRTEFDNAVFSYGLRMKDDLEELTAEFRENTITLNVPKKKAAHWDANDKVGYENTLSLKNGETLHLLLEKDFVCLDERGEDESDNYPNPKMATVPSGGEKK